jgi:hypothetical protein
MLEPMLEPMKPLINKPLSYAIITPSYEPDFQRCRLLSGSIQQQVQSDFTHYIVVERRDYSLFKTLANDRTEILLVESLLPWWIQREPLKRKMWLSLKTLPVRNWVMQQLMKITVAQQIDQDIAVFIDSDVAFVRPFDLAQLSQGVRVRLYRDDVGNDVQRQMHRKWHETGAKLLGLPGINPQIPDYIGNLITWRKENVQQMCQHIEAVSGRSWLSAIAHSWHLSEYILYGMFIDQVLGDRAGQYANAHNYCSDYWFPRDLSEAELADWIKNIDESKVAVMISAKAGIAVDRYAPLIQQVA